MTTEFIVVMTCIEGNLEQGFATSYYSDLKRLPCIEQVIRHGCVELDQSDDFLIGKIVDNKLVSLQWMEEVRDDRDEVLDVARQLCLDA